MKSKRAVEVNIAIMRTFVKMRDMISSHYELFQKMTEMTKYDENFDAVFATIRELMDPAPNPNKGGSGSPKQQT